MCVCVCVSTPEACRKTGAEAHAEVSETWRYGKHLLGWPRNNTAHLEATPLGYGPSDGWGGSFEDVQLSLTTGAQSITPPTPTPLVCSSLTQAHPSKDPQGSRVLSRHLRLLAVTLDHTDANVIVLSVRSTRS